MAVVTVWSDIGCPWAHLAVHRLLESRRRLGLETEIQLDHRCFPLELFNRRPTPKRSLSAEIPVVGALAPDARWQLWQGPEWKWPNSMLPALEAVQVAKEQGLEASARLDRALRVAFFGESRSIDMRHVVLDVAGACAEVDERALEEGLDSGRGRARVIADWRAAEASGAIEGSPHLFLPDGSDVHNPGVETHWEGDHGKGFPVVDADDPKVYDGLLRSALGVDRDGA